MAQDYILNIQMKLSAFSSWSQATVGNLETEYIFFSSLCQQFMIDCILFKPLPATYELLYSFFKPLLASYELLYSFQASAGNLWIIVFFKAFAGNL